MLLQACSEIFAQYAYLVLQQLRQEGPNQSVESGKEGGCPHHRHRGGNLREVGFAKADDPPQDRNIARIVEAEAITIYDETRTNQCAFSQRCCP